MPRKKSLPKDPLSRCAAVGEAVAVRVSESAPWRRGVVWAVSADYLEVRMSDDWSTWAIPRLIDFIRPVRIVHSREAA